VTNSAKAAAAGAADFAGTTAVAVFTRDLRLHDNPMFAEAAAADRVVPLFVLDDAILSRVPKQSGRLAFLSESLTDLDAGLRRLGGRLVLRRGDLVEEVCRVAHETGAAEVHISADVSLYARDREQRLEEALGEEGRRLHRYEQVHTVQVPGDLVPADRDHFAVFTPYLRHWADAPLRVPAKPPRSVTVPDIDGLSVPDLGSPVNDDLVGGETAARKRAQRWLGQTVEDYSGIHDDLAADATSRLSPYLHFGCLSATELVARASRDHTSAGAEAFVRQLAWRDFHHQVLAARPDVVHADYRSRSDSWNDNDDALAAWTEGRTGIPIVDAGMRQLHAEGWMHNRARLITASFLSKTLYIDWRDGAAHFAAHLLDADVANNTLNWQWVAGTGTDTRPNRVLNPLRQAARYDPDAAYVRRYVPELADLENPKDAHQPWRLGEDELRRRDYPMPIVDLDGARRRFLEARAEPLF
jgi:deoxyribodipyrimidine photo-lyase